MLRMGQFLNQGGRKIPPGQEKKVGDASVHAYMLHQPLFKLPRLEITIDKIEMEWKVISGQ